MKLLATIMLTFSLSSSLAVAAQPSEASVRQLLEVTNASSLIGSMHQQVEGQIERQVQMAFRGQQPNEQQRQAIEKLRKDVNQLLTSEVTWAKVEPVSIRIYQETLTQQEVDAMLEFYDTPAGQAMIHKMPQVVGKTLQQVQEQMRSLGPKMQQLQQGFVAQLKAAAQTDK